ncbi:PREDICTED: ninjurin-1-like [Vollenhovia emeryi]|uniref:ninjurin-1-like n=1 Tax=Vollenhovia emeryi TaxID=411798 RepID=UPI0005F4DF10|nr:PREDICTED: ninjurin-1-like [Vollenhovia emeryi]XP_011875435.1 PREDICTED: ninjurin-1-like [Vollenhovia emeryi]XP_011875436.1 PREDICTED: ninjurin-1-like [Vollenhovia emeryi]XP_011875437.1 PREDICTED: ninjurin-1-like [Vollenhovia emeryi]XP_011875439.1 PREDICTED: ninjurin-1-like [Vollenhovia emeryi]XP_011875440.1 PREDICTED: ninjurin-1-like [Vollenhovia emeryi]XP_011875441.1 PREDICTED: ninjurin-1-like [Vollenhovia emeryi]
MNDRPTSTKIEVEGVVLGDSPYAPTTEEVQENIVVKEPVAAMDTTDKKGQNYNTRQANSYAAKKTVAQGMMDVALITANANQLRYLIEYQRSSPTFYLIMILIIISLLLQIAVGISLIFKGRFDIKGMSKSPSAQRINNYVVVGVFLITIINVFIAAFSITAPDTQPLSALTSANRA